MSSLRSSRTVSLTRVALLLFLFAGLLPHVTQAQVSGGQGAITGRIVDPAGAAVPGAIVTLSDTQRGTTRTLRSDGAGYYAAAALEVGTYTLEVKASTFAISRTDTITLTVGATLAIDLKLKPESVGTTVEVSTDSDPTRRTDTDTTGLIDSAQVEDLPTRGRNFTDFALLTPGISQEQDRFGLVINGQRSSNLYISIDGFDFTDPLQGGQRGGNNAGVYFFPQVAVREFEVVRTGVPAEVGRTNGGFLNVVTKSGTNRYHGEAFYTNRNPYLTWSSPFGNPETNNQQNQAGAAVGGPILHDRLFFFAGVEKNWLQIPYSVSFTTPAGYCEPMINGAGQTPCVTGDGLIPIPSNVDGLQVNSYGLNNPLASFGRLDYQANATNRFTLQYTGTFLSGLNFGQTNAVQNTAPTNNSGLSQQSQGLTLAWTTVLGANKTNDARIQYAYDNRQQTPGSSASQIDIGDLGTIGGNSNGILVYRAIRAEAIDNFSLLLGKHSLRFGVDMNWEPETQQREADAAGDWTIDTFAHYVEALPVSQGGGGMTPQQVNATCGGKASAPCIQFDQTLPANGGPELRYTGTEREFAGYIEDSYRVLPRLTLNAGFRYEAQLNPQPTSTNPAFPQTAVIPDDITMFQPRLAFAWDAYGGGHTVVRASVGLLDARTPAYIFARDFTDNGLLNDNLNSTYNPNLLSDVPYLGQLTAVPAGLAIINAVYVNAVNSKNPRSVQDALSVTQELTRSMVLTIGFVQNETYDLQHRLDTNLFEPTINAFTRYPVFPKINPETGVACKFAGVSVPCRPNSTIAGYHQNFGSAHSTYRAMQVELVQQLTHHFEAAVNFAWAAARDDDSNERDFDRELALDSLCTACYNKGYSTQDIRNSGNLRAVYRFPLGFVYSNTLQVRTALPYTATLSGSNADQNNDGNTNNDRPILCGPAYSVCNTVSSLPNLVAGRNTFRQPGFINLDMRLIKVFKIVHHTQDLEFSAEGFNVTRAANENFGTNADSKFGKAQATINPATGFYYSNSGAGIATTSPATNRPGGPRQIQLGARYIF